MSEYKKYCYKYPRPALTADCVIFGFDGRELRLLLIERGLEPYLGYWALPGGFLRMDETIDQCAARELREETGLSDVYMRQFGVFSSVDRDPRGRVVTVAFLALVSSLKRLLNAGDDAAAAHWFPLDELPPLAFDHAEIVAEGEKTLKDELRHSTAAFKLLDRHFSMTELHRLAEWASGKPLDRRNFERKIMAQGVVAQVAAPAPAPELGPIRCPEVSQSVGAEEPIPYDAPRCCPSPIPGPRARKRLFSFCIKPKTKQQEDPDDDFSLF